MRKWWSTSNLNFRRRRKTTIEERENKKTRRRRCENTCRSRWMKKNKNKLQRRKSTTSRLKYGRKTLTTSTKIRRRSRIIWRAFTGNMKMFWRTRWKKSRIKRTERRWTPSSSSTTRPWWRQQQIRMSMWGRGKFDLRIYIFIILNLNKGYNVRSRSDLIKQM